MSDPIVWENIPKSQSDPQTIGEAIAEGVNVHNEDIEAHMAELQSLEAHRTNNIVDHPANSVVNDKLAPRSRAYIAIVDPDSETDFDTVQAAHDYAVDEGGGTILIVPGDHYISGAFEISPSVNFEGIDPDTCNIIASYTGGDYCYYQNSGITGKPTSTWYNLGIVDDGGGFFHEPPADDPADIYTRFVFCKFTGSGNYLKFVSNNMYVSNCYFDITSDGAIACVQYLTLVQNFITCSTGGVDGKLFHSATGWLENWIDLIDNEGDENSTNEIDYVPTTGVGGKIISGNKFWKCANNEFIMSGIACVGNFFSGTYSADFIIKGGYNSIVGNKFNISSSNEVELHSTGSNNVFVGNMSDGLVDDNGTDNLVMGNQPELNYKSLGSSTTALDLAKNNLAQLTPNSTRTLTTTVPVAGTRRTLKILTSGSTSYVLTFGSGFKTTGTLTTGITTNRIFIVNFISDGTNMLETGRTAAYAA